MDGFIQGAIGGIIPAGLMVVVYLVAVSGRLAKIETNICWMKKELRKCQPPLKDPSQ